MNKIDLLFTQNSVTNEIEFNFFSFELFDTTYYEWAVEKAKHYGFCPTLHVKTDLVNRVGFAYIPIVLYN